MFKVGAFSLAARARFLTLTFIVVLSCVAISLAQAWEHVYALLFPAGQRLVDVVTAIGTVAAAGVALWLGTTQLRRLDDDKREVAALVASEISARLQEACHELAKVSALWDFGDETHSDRENRVNDVKALKNLLTHDMLYFKRDTLVALVPLEKNAAHRIARASDYLKLCKRHIERSTHAIEKGSEGLSKHLHAKLGELIYAAQRELNVATAVCVEAAKLGAPEVSDEEYYED